MKNKDLFQLQSTLEALKAKGDNRFKLNLILNLKVINERISALELLREPSEQIKALQQQQQDLIKEYCIKGEGNEPIVFDAPGKNAKPTSGPGYYHVDDSKLDAYQKALLDLEKENKEEVEAHATKERDFADTLEQPAEPIELHKLKFEDIPEIDYEALEVLNNFLVA